MFRGIFLNIMAILIAVQSQQSAPSLHVPILWMVVSISSQFRHLFVFDILIVLSCKFVAMIIGDFLSRGFLVFSYGDLVYISPY
jgi:hypothetical protein